MNRLWQWHFGEGLQKIASDFGELGGKPSHPPLLDWLASEFVQRGFQHEADARLMVTSDAYKLASEAGAELCGSNQKIDPGDTASGISACDGWKPSRSGIRSMPRPATWI